MKENTRVVVILSSIALVLAVMGAGSWWLLAEHGDASPVPGISKTIEMWTQDQIDAAERAVGATGLLDSSVERFRLRIGRYPQNLDELVTAPADAVAAEQWDGPYVHNTNLLVDPWGNLYRIAAPGVYNKERFDLWSTGPDGADGTSDDIGNW